MITFSFSPISGSTLPFGAGVCEDPRVFWKETADRKLSVASEAFVIPANVETPQEANAEELDQTGAGDRTRTDDLCITSALSGNLPESAESSATQDPSKIETSETGCSEQDP